MNTTAIQNSVRAEIYRILSECYKEPCRESAKDVAEGRFYQELKGNLERLGITVSLEGIKLTASGLRGRVCSAQTGVERREGEAPSPMFFGGRTKHRPGSGDGGGRSLPYEILPPSGFASWDGEESSGICGVGGRLLPSRSDEAINVLQLLKEIYYPLFVGPSPSLALPVESVYKEWAKDGTTLVSSEVRGMLMGDPAIDMIRRYKEAGIEIPKEYKDIPDHLTLLLEYMAFLCEAGAECEQEQFVKEHLDWLPELRRLIYSCTEKELAGYGSQFYRTMADVTVAFVTYERQTYLRKNGI